MEKLLEIDSDCGHEGDKQGCVNGKYMKKELAERFKQKHEIFFGCKIGEELGGYVTLKPFFPGHKHCELYWLTVKRKFQNQGVGTKLVRFIEEYAKKKGFRKVCVYTGKTMKKTIHFYKKMGYEKINEFPGYYGYEMGNTTAILLAKNI